MNQSYSLNILAQLNDNEPVTEGMSEHGSKIIAINNTYSYFGLADDKDDSTARSARLALEILQDDIQINLSSREYAQATNYEKHVLATHCIQESFENINDYLISQGNSAPASARHGVALSVLQVLHGECSFIHADEHCCLHFSEGKLNNLTQADSDDGDSKTLLGVSDNLNIKVKQLTLASSDLLITCTHELLQCVTEEFLRVTVSRFLESPDMLLRQINSKAQRNGMQGKPLLIIVAIKMVDEKPKGWFGR